MMKSLRTADPDFQVPVICGPTASGKTALAVELFSRGSCEAVSSDSVQIYRMMDIGSAKPSREERTALPHRLIDIRNPDEIYSAGEFFRDAIREVSSLHAAGKQPLILGGTGLYLKTLINGFFDGPSANPEIRTVLETEEKNNPGCLYKRLQSCDPDTAERISANDLRRTIRALEVYRITGKPISLLRREGTSRAPFGFRIAGIIHDRAVLEERICRRVDLMFEEGLVEEVEQLLRSGYNSRLSSMQSLGYRHVYEYLCGTRDLESCSTALKKDTVAFARRQIMLFKKIPGLTWFNGGDSAGLRRYFKDYRG